MKGDYNDECYRTACDISPATFFNHSTEKHYCVGCADLINRHNAADAYRLFGHDLCTRVCNDPDSSQNSNFNAVHIGTGKIPQHVSVNSAYNDFLI